MADVMALLRGFFRLVLRAVLLLMGLVFLLSLLVVALLLLLFWLLGALWDRLRGRPVQQPMVFTFFRRAQWERFYRPGQKRRADDSEVIEVQAQPVDADRLPGDRA